MRNAAKVGVCFLLLILADGSKGDDPKPNPSGLAKEVETWLYPGATVVSSAESAGRIFQAVLTTADAQDTVLKHHDKKCGTSLADGDHPPGVFDSKSDFADGKFTATLSADDSTIPATTRKQKASRGVTMLQLTRDEPGFFVTVLVTRTKDEAKTHLLVTYLKK
jgi:hypothetical protein